MTIPAPAPCPLDWIDAARMLAEARAIFRPFLSRGIVDWSAEDHRDYTRASELRVAALAEMDRLFAADPDGRSVGIAFYRNADDTEEAEATPDAILDTYDYGDVVGIQSIAVIETTYWISLPRAWGSPDADQWTFHARTPELAEGAAIAEIIRRAARNTLHPDAVTDHA